MIELTHVHSRLFMATHTADHRVHHSGHETLRVDSTTCCRLQSLIRQRIRRTMVMYLKNSASRAEIAWSRNWNAMQHNAGLSQSAHELRLRDGRFARLNGPRLALLKPDGTFESSYLLSEITECSNPKETREVFLRLWTKEEVTLLASSIADAQTIVQWAAHPHDWDGRHQHAARGSTKLACD